MVEIVVRGVLVPGSEDGTTIDTRQGSIHGVRLFG